MTNTPTLRILQYNIRHEMGTMTALLTDRAVQDIDILAIQEPSYNSHNRSSYNPGFSSFHLAHRTEADIRTYFYINKRINPDVWEVEHPSRDICTLIIKPEESETPQGLGLIHIHNVYNPSPSLVTDQNPSSLALVEVALERPGEHILLGDFNLHHPSWNNPGRFSYHREADELITMTLNKEMESALPNGAVTWRARKAESAIDLIFVTPGVKETMLSCQVRPELQHGSDHLPVYTEFELTVEEPVPIQRRAWKTAKSEDVKRGAQALNLTLSLNPLTSPAQIDAYLDSLLRGLNEVVELTVPWAKPPQRVKSFWNEDCNRAVSAAKGRTRHYQNSRSERSATNMRRAIQERDKILSKAKALHFRNGVHKAAQSPKGIWKLDKWARNDSMNPRPLPKTMPLQQSTGGLTTTFEGKVSVLREAFFPPPPQADLTDTQGAVYPTPLAMTDILTEGEVRKAIFRPKPDKAPGIDGMPNRFLRQITGALISKITHLFQACLKTGYHPREFKKANTIVLRKPKKEDYSEPKAYRPIALLSTLGKALETVVATKLSDCAEANELLPPEQMGARRKRSTETALETIVDAIHTVWDCGKANVASLLSLDVAGAFDNVSHERLIHNLRAKGVPEFIINWTRSFLTERATSITLGNKTSPMEPAQTGIPQGSPISPVLFLFFNAPLIEECIKAKLKLQVGGFVDDIHLLAYGKSTEINCLTLKKAHEICLKWAKTHGATFAPKKYELVHLTRCPKRFNMTATVDLGETVTKPKTSIRVLGLHIDGKLRWGPHIKEVRSKLATQCLALSKTAGSTWGATLNKARQVYNMVIQPAIAYAAASWHTPYGLRETKRTHVKNLGVIQNTCLRQVTGGYKATSVRVLEAEAGIPPLQITLDQAVLRNQALRGMHPVTKKGNAHIRRKLRPKRGRKREALETPTEEKEQWALRMLKLNNWDTVLLSNRERNARKLRKAIEAWRNAAWDELWNSYQSAIPEALRTPAQEGDLWTDRRTLHANLAKAESSALTQMRTGKIGLAHFLYSRRVPDVWTASCACGWRCQDVKHIFMFCPMFQDRQRGLVQTAGTNDLHRMLTTPKGAKAATKWLIQTGLLGQYSLANEQLYGK